MQTLLLIALLLPGGTPPADWTDKALRAVEQAVREAVKLPPDDLLVEVRGIALPATEGCVKAVIVRVPAEPLPPLRGNVSLPVELVCGDVVRGRGIVSVTIRTFERVAVTSAVLGRHTVLKPGDVACRRIETTGMRGTALSGDSTWAGLRTTRMLAEGTVLRRDMLETPPVIGGGTPVTLRVRSGQAIVSVRAIAREDGRMNQWIVVEQQASRRTLLARVTGPGTVELTLE